MGIAVNEALQNGVCVVDVYAAFDDLSPPPNLLNVFNIEMEIAGGFESLLHSDSMGGSWAPQLSIDPAFDTFATIGGEAVFSNATGADPHWGPMGFNQIGILPLAGWFNNNPPAHQGTAQMVTLSDLAGNTTFSGLASRIMRLVFTDPGAAGKEFSISGWVTYNDGLIPNATPSTQEPFAFSAALCAIPAPGAIATLALSSMIVTGSRRRRA